jgi:hypothetical protein
MINKLKTLVKNVFGKKDVTTPPVVEVVKPAEPEPKWEVKITPVESSKPKQNNTKRGPKPQQTPKQQSNNSQVKKPAVKQGTAIQAPAKQAPKKTIVNKNKGDPNADKSRTSK